MFEVVFLVNHEKLIGCFTQEQIDFIEKHTEASIISKRGI